MTDEPAGAASHTQKVWIGSIILPYFPVPRAHAWLTTPARAHGPRPKRPRSLATSMAFINLHAARGIATSASSSSRATHISAPPCPARTTLLVVLRSRLRSWPAWRHLWLSVCDDDALDTLKSHHPHESWLECRWQGQVEGLYSKPSSMANQLLARPTQAFQMRVVVAKP